MKVLIKIILILAIALCGAYYYRNVVLVPCDKPITYKIGTIDAGFGITKEEFKTVIETASEAWEKPIGKNLFQYDDAGKLTINLIYDHRQMITDTNQELKADVDKISGAAQSVREQYTSLKSQLANLQNLYNSSVSDFEARQSKYNDDVNYWNDHGGAPRDEYNALNAERNSLETERASLEAKRQQINSLVDEINAFIKKYNLLVNQANTNISKINQNAGVEFEEGLYTPSTNTIDIYEYSNKNKFIRVTAHELGHALGIDHNDNIGSIMYKSNIGSNLSLSKEDLSSLKSVCNLNN
ncbi:MAG: hypothetical protein JWN37_655 [Candidatus Nomurabacteria bacterium]|nr:hypothetical protein [Candidatus Nomurabacteria bacterium]